MFARVSLPRAVIFAATFVLATPLTAAHRVLVLDTKPTSLPHGTRGAEQQRLRLVDIDTGDVVADHWLGSMSSIDVSHSGEWIAAVSFYRGERSRRLKVLRADNLQEVASGLLRPMPLRDSKLGATRGNVAFSPDGRQLLLQSPQGRNGSGQTKLIRLTQDLNAEGYFTRDPSDLAVPDTTFIHFLHLKKWPRAHVWNWWRQRLEVINVNTGEISSSVQVAQDPAVVDENPRSPEQHIRGRGNVISGMRSTAYFIPYSPRRHPSVPYPTKEPGYLVKVDLTTDPPTITGRSTQPHADLRPPVAVVCDPGDKLFVMRESWNEHGTHEPSRVVKVFRASDLSLEHEVELPLEDCNELAVSSDAKYLYALDSSAAALVVVDVATLQASKVIDSTLGDHPLLMFPIPGTGAP